MDTVPDISLLVRALLINCPGGGADLAAFGVTLTIEASVSLQGPTTS